MSNSIFDWPASLKRFVRFTSAKAEEVNDALDDLSAGLDTVEADIKRAVKLPIGTADQTLSLAAGQRAGLLLGFDPSGNIAGIAGGGRWRGDWTAATPYAIADYFRDPVSKNIYACVEQHTATSIAADLAANKVRLAIDVAEVENQRILAQQAATAANGSYLLAAQKASDAAQSAVDATNNGAAQVTLAAQQVALATQKAQDAEAARAAAVIAQQGAEAALDSFDDRYLGQKPADPATDNDGGALVIGALYFRTTAPIGMKVWTGAAWDDAYANLSSKFDKTGGDISGNVNLPSLNGGQLAGFRNKIINGKMEIAQRGTSFTAVANGAFNLDHWKVITSSAGVCTASYQTDVPGNNEFQSSLRVVVTTADASVASSDRFELLQVVEGFNVRDLIGRTFTLSFWVRSGKTGVHCVALGNSSGDRSYVAEYTVNAANTWEQKSITVSSGLITAGTWDWTNGWGLGVRFTLMAGSSVQAAQGAWLTGNFTATANQVNCLDTVGNIFAITGVQLEVGSVATPFEHRPYGLELALCQRYYYRLQSDDTNCVFGVGMADSATRGFAYGTFPVPMRVSPPGFEQSGTAGHYSFRSGGIDRTCSAVPLFSSSTSANHWYVETTVASGQTTGHGGMFIAINPAAFIAWNAEL